MDFTTMDIYAITAGKGSDGTGYLQLFLQAYTRLFSEKVNPSCHKCLNEYLTRYKNYYKQMANTCKYRLHAKYENIPLEFGSPILVNNGNITDAYALKLMEQNNGIRYFAALPHPDAPADARVIRKKRKRINKETPLPTSVPDGNIEEISSDDAQ